MASGGPAACTRACRIRPLDPTGDDGVAQTSTRMNTMLLTGTLSVFLGLGSGALVFSVKAALTRQASIGSLDFWLLLAHAALIGVMLLCAMSVWRRRKWGLATLVAAAFMLFDVDVYAGILTPGQAILLLLMPAAMVALAARASWSDFR